MAPFTLVLLAILSAHPLPAHVAHASDTSPQKTWINDDIPWLEANAPISVFHPVVAAEPVPAAASGPYAKELDPDWYRKEIATRLSAIDADNIQIRALQTARVSGAGLSGAISLAAPMSIDADATILALQSQVKALNAEISSLQDLARQNSIAPGAIR